MNVLLRVFHPFPTLISIKSSPSSASVLSASSYEFPPPDVVRSTDYNKKAVSIQGWDFKRFCFYKTFLFLLQNVFHLPLTWFPLLLARWFSSWFPLVNPPAEPTKPEVKDETEGDSFGFMDTSTWVKQKSVLYPWSPRFLSITNLRSWLQPPSVWRVTFCPS